MPIFDRKMFADPSESSGVFMDGLGAALTTWTAMQNRLGVTVAEAATAFNTTAAVIKEAIDKHCDWAIILGSADQWEADPTKQIIELDGE